MDYVFRNPGLLQLRTSNLWAIICSTVALKTEWVNLGKILAGFVKYKHTTKRQL